MIVSGSSCLSVSTTSGIASTFKAHSRAHLTHEEVVVIGSRQKDHSQNRRM